MHDRRSAIASLVSALVLALVGFEPSAAGSRSENTLVPKSMGGAAPDFPSRAPDLDGTGRRLVFESFATNLVLGDRNQAVDVFLYDRAGKQTRLLSRGPQGGSAGGPSHSPRISSDGRFVVFVSGADDLVADDGNGFDDVFLVELSDDGDDRVELISIGRRGAAADGASAAPVVSADGRYVAFVSEATNLVEGDTAGYADVFLRDREAGVTTRVSVGRDGAEPNGPSRVPSIAAGPTVAFASRASNLVEGDGNGTWDVFVRTGDGPVKAVSVGGRGETGDGASFGPSLAADASALAFSTWASDIVRGGGKRRESVLACTLRRPRCTLVSAGADGESLRRSSWDARMSTDGRWVAFFTLSAVGIEGLGPAGDVLLRDLRRPSALHALRGGRPLMPSGTRMQPALSSDASVIAWVSAPADGRDRSRHRSYTTIVLQEHDAGPARCGNARVEGDEQCDDGEVTDKPGIACSSKCRRRSCGDVDGDGTITTRDAGLAMRMASGQAACDERVCDVDGSGGPVTISDALRLLHHALGRPHALLCPGGDGAQPEAAGPAQDER
jgi:cysteine-rich repeat protein